MFSLIFNKHAKTSIQQKQTKNAKGKSPQLSQQRFKSVRDRGSNMKTQLKKDDGTQQTNKG